MSSIASAIEARPTLRVRLLSLDAFRGFIIAAMILVTDPGTYSARYAPLCHSDWTGPTATDMISPAFLLIIGIAMPFSIANKRLGLLSRGRLFLDVVRRCILLLILGLFLNGFPDFNVHTLRFPGILQHIAVCYCAAAMLYLLADSLFTGPHNPRPRRRGLILGATALVLLLLYGSLIKWFPVPGFGPGHLDSLGSLPAYVDRTLFGVRHLWPYGTTPGYGVTFDPDGLLSSLSGIAIMLIGLLTGEYLRSSQTKQHKFTVLAGTAVCLIVLGYGLGPWQPLIKKLWTPPSPFSAAA